MAIKTKIGEAAASELTKQIILLLLPLLSGLVLALVPQVRDRILPVLSKPLLAVIAGLSLSLNLALFFYVLRLRKAVALSQKLTPKFGVLWTRDQVPHCPACRKPLGHYGEYAVGNWKRMGFKCLSCRQVVLMSNDDGRILELTEAKRLLSSDGLTANAQPFEPDNIEVNILKLLAEERQAKDENSLKRALDLHIERVRFYLQELIEHKYIYASSIPPVVGSVRPTEYLLTKKGRAFLKDKELI